MYFCFATYVFFFQLFGLPKCLLPLSYCFKVFFLEIYFRNKIKLNVIVIVTKKSYIIIDYKYKNVNKNFNVIWQKYFVSIKNIDFYYNIVPNLNIKGTTNNHT